MDYYKNIRFTEAAPLIKYVNERADIIKSENIRGIYPTERLCWSEDTAHKKEWTTSKPLVIEFDQYVVQMEYVFQSDLDVEIIDHDSFYEGEITRHLFGIEAMKKNRQPLVRIPELQIFHGPITEFVIKRFSEEFETEPSRGTVRPSGGDYFDSISIMFGDEGLHLCPEDVIMDGYLDYHLIDKTELKRMIENDNAGYEIIEI